MKPFLLLATLLVASTCSASLHGVISTQYQTLDPHSHTYSYGYADPNSQKHESRSHDGVTRGSYSYVDANGHVQSVSYTADPHSGFNAVGTNLPKAPANPHPQYAAAHSYVPLAYSHAAPALHYVALTHAGVPVDTPEVQHAKAQHAAAHAAAAHAAAASPDLHHLYKRSLYAGPWAYQHAAPAVQLTHGGVPVDEPDVQAAKAEHYAAHAKALGQVAHAHGAPIETPEVQHAKAAHFAAHAAARSGHSISHAPINHHGYHIPVIHNGVPVETPEVQQAKAKHFAAVAEASANAGSSHGDDGSYDGRWDNKWEGNKWENKWENKWDEGRWDGHQQQHKGPIHIPVIHNGVPVEPAEVQHARAAHLSALAAASHNAGHGGWNGAHNDGDDGQYRPSYNHY